MAWWVKRPVLSLILLLFIVFGGIFSYISFPVNIFPRLSFPVFNIITHYPGVSPRNMELMVTNPIESAMLSIQGVRRVSSSSAEGFSQVTVEFGWGTSHQEARSLVLTALSKAEHQLPEGVKPVLEDIGSAMQEMMGISLIIHGTSPQKARIFAEKSLVPGLQALKGVAHVSVIGGQKPAFMVEMDPQAMARYGTSLQDILQAIRDNNLLSNGGFMERFHRDFFIRGINLTPSIEELRRIIVKNPGHNPVTLSMVARVHKGTKPKRYVARADGKDAVILTIIKQRRASTLAVSRRVRAFLKKASLPSGLEMKTWYDQAELIGMAAHTVRTNLLFGGLMAALVLFYFLRNLSATLLVFVSIPLSMMLAFIFMKWWGLSLNLMTLNGLTVALGMLVDNAIVVMENIFQHREQGEEIFASVVQGTREMVIPILTSTLTTVIVFLPLAFFHGPAGLFFRPFGMTVALTLLASFIIASTLVPGLAPRAIKVMKEPPSLPLLARFMKLNARALSRTKRHPGKILAGAFIALFILAGGLALLNRFAFLPPVDEGAMLISLVMPPGTSLRETAQMGERVEGMLRKDPNVTTTYLRIGSAEGTFQVEPANEGEIVAKLKPQNKRKERIEEIIDRWRRRLAKIKGVLFFINQPTSEKMEESFSGLPALFGLTIMGQKEGKLLDLANKAEQLMSQTPGITGVNNPYKIKVPEIDITLNRDKASFYKVDGESFSQTVEALYGIVPVRLTKEQVTIPIWVRYPPEFRQTLEAIEDLPLVEKDGAMVPLSAIAKIQEGEAPPMITHINGTREVTLTADVGGNIFSTARKVEERVKRILPKGYRAMVIGQYRDLVNTALVFLISLMAAVILVYLILVVQFQEAKIPIVIMTTVPLSFIGALVGLLVTRESVDVSAMVGVLMLVGTVVNNAIVLVDTVKRYREEGMELATALQEATRSRTRPILMTTLTTVLALLPAAINHGPGSEIQRPLAVVVIGGLTLSTLLTLNVVPAFYYMLSREKTHVKS